MSAFEKSVGKIRESTSQLLGISIEESLTEEHEKTFRCRMESRELLGECVVWGRGTAYFSVASLTSGDFVFEHDGIDIQAAEFDSTLRSFISLFVNS